jgi:hypothetical protein
LGRSYQHKVNHEFFAFPNALNSYWAGYLAADGCVDDKSGHRTITVTASIRDERHIVQFKEDVEFTGGIRKWAAKSGYKPGAEYVTLSINSVDTWIKDLRDNFGIGPRKTHTLLPPVGLGAANSLAYCAGFIDGDGSVVNPKTSWAKGSATIGIAGRYQMMSWIKEQFDRIAPVRYNHKAAAVGKWKDKDFWHYAVSGQRAVAVARALRALGLPLLQRKWNKVPA